MVNFARRTVLLYTIVQIFPTLNEAQTDQLHNNAAIGQWRCLTAVQLKLREVRQK